MTLGILVYVDATPEMVEEFYWLYKSVLYSRLRGGCRIIALCHPDVMALLPDDDLIRKVASVPISERDDRWSDYKFVNSVGNLSDKTAIAATTDCEYLLKTDCDTFVTSNLRGFRPANLCFGFGEYAYEAEVRRNLEGWSDKLGFPHIGTHNVGASVLGPRDMVMTFVQVQMEYCERLLEEEFADSIGVWPGWYRGVLTMYAGELALRATYPQRHTLGLLDHHGFGDRTMGSEVLHIHAWHSSHYFSKHEYRAGAYAHIPIEQIDVASLAGYCHFLAAADPAVLRAREPR